MKRVVVLVAAAVLLGGTYAAASVVAVVEKRDAPGIRNFSELNGPPGFAGERAGFGGATQASAMRWLHGEGFTTVVDLRLATEEGVDIEGNQAAAEAAGLRYLHIAFSPKAASHEEVERFLAAVHDPANQPVYIHCNSATRAAALWMVGRVLIDGLDLDTARLEVEAIAENPEDAIAFASTYVASQTK